MRDPKPSEVRAVGDQLVEHRLAEALLKRGLEINEFQCVEASLGNIELGKTGDALVEHCCVQVCMTQLDLSNRSHICDLLKDLVSQHPR